MESMRSLVSGPNVDLRGYPEGDAGFVVAVKFDQHTADLREALTPLATAWHALKTTVPKADQEGMFLWFRADSHPGAPLVAIRVADARRAADALARHQPRPVEDAE